jgi:hypothetical protein
LRIPVAIVIAGLLIAGTILIAFRWQISAATGIVYRLDKWSGRIVACELSGTPCYNIGPTQ